MEKRIQWTPTTKKLFELKPYDKNPRIITELGLNQLGESFDEIGFAQPININTDGTILSGHARFKKLEIEGAQEVLCMVPDRTLTPKQEEAVIIRMNKNVAGQWDFDILANQFEVEDLKDWGFKDYELADFLKLEEVNTGDENSEWVGMPEFESKTDTFKIIIHFEHEATREEFANLHELQFKKKQGNAWSTTFPYTDRDDLASVKYE
jgi:hypothetical protein